MFIELHESETGLSVFIRADSVQMVGIDPDTRGTLVLTSSGCSAWVKETPGSVVGLILQEEERQSLEERECV